MELGDIILDSFKYPLSDTNKFIKLAIPSLVIAGIIALIELFAFMSNSGNTSNVLAMIIGVLGILFFVLIFIVALINSGLILNVIRYIINGKTELPELEVGKFAIDGIKSVVVVFIYVIVPIFIIGILSAIFMYLDLSIVSVILMLLVYVVIFILTLLFPAIYGTLAETNSISEALSISKVWDITKQIGFVKVFLVLIIFNVVVSILSMIILFIMFIPVIGPIIVALIFTYYSIASGHCYGLLYLEKDQDDTFNNQYQFNQPNQPIESSQQDDSNQALPEDNTQDKPLDFQRPNNQENTDKTESCPNCGTENKSDAKFCMTCGEEL